MAKAVSTKTKVTFGSRKLGKAVKRVQPKAKHIKPSRGQG